jgi:hypothetical protein
MGFPFVFAPAAGLAYLHPLSAQPDREAVSYERTEQATGLFHGFI